MTTNSAPVADFLGPTGNATDKYAARNPVTRYLLNRFLRDIDSIVVAQRPRSILDVGCGEGIVTERLAQLTGATTVGVDLGDDAMRRRWAAREHDHLSFLAASAYELPFAAGSFDLVCALEVLEHLERPRSALAEMTRVAARTLVLSVPREPLWRAAHVLAGRDLRRLGNTPGHINHWTSRRFRRLASEFGAVRRDTRPFPWTIVTLDV